LHPPICVGRAYIRPATQQLFRRADGVQQRQPGGGTGGDRLEFSAVGCRPSERSIDRSSVAIEAPSSEWRPTWFATALPHAAVSTGFLCPLSRVRGQLRVFELIFSAIALREAN